MVAKVYYMCNNHLNLYNYKYFESNEILIINKTTV